VIGAAAAEHFGALPGWRALGVSRRAPDPLPPAYQHVALDLTDAAAPAFDTSSRSAYSVTPDVG